MKNRLIISACIAAAALSCALLLIDHPSENDQQAPDDAVASRGEDDPNVTETRYPGGAIKERREVRLDSESETEILVSYVQWSESGEKIVEMFDQDGEKNGKATFWHGNRRKSVEGEFRNGKRHGKVLTWHENGKKASEGEYRDGKTHGRVTPGSTTARSGKKGNIETASDRASLRCGTKRVRRPR